MRQLAKDYALSESSLYRHRINCLKLNSSNAIKKESARASAALALLPTAATLGESYQVVGERIDEIVTQAQKEGSLRIALSGLASLRQNLDSLARLAAQDHDTAKPPQSAPGYVDPQQIAERLIQEFDHEPDVKARVALALLGMDNAARTAALRPDPNGAVADAQTPPGKQASTSEPGSVLPVPAAVLTAIDTAQADHATVMAVSTPCKTLHADDNSPRHFGGSNTPPVNATALIDRQRDAFARPAGVAPPNGQTPATNRPEAGRS